ncbi:MAG: DUF4435 domain-containing protein [Prevotella sp.]|nr:DUF4435 domain-containing protein [Prevotella sp.]
MPSSLKENISSKYFEAANRLRPKTARRRIVAYVEAYDDIFFWRSVLGDFEDDTRYFEVMLPTKVGKLERGKKAALMNMLTERVGESMIACVDADYDYLEQGATAMSHIVTTNPYVFHTYAYAIENLQCYGPSLRDICVAVTLNDRQLFDCDEYLRQYSQAVFPLFVWSIWYYRRPDYTEFSITDFLRVIETGHFTIERAPDIIANIRRKVSSKIHQLQRKHPEAKKTYLKVKDDLARLGVTPETTYLYIQGHHLMDKVVVPMLKKICDQLIRERQQEINRQSQHNTQRRNELSCYTGSIGNIEATLRRNLGYFRSAPFQRIRQDVAAFLQKK